MAICAAAMTVLAAPVWLAAQSKAPVTWKRGVEGQRQADLGDGRYLNPILAGDRPDPSVVRDGNDYYMVHSSFENYPGLLVWRSRDLVNWAPVGPALTTNVGIIWAPDIVKHNGRFYIYFPARRDGYRSNFVVWADRIEGPWSEPVDLKVPQIDPGHIVGEDGKRYLFLSAGMRVQLADDGLSVVGAPTKVYDGWKYPETWDVDGFALEGPKLLRHGELLLSAVGRRRHRRATNQPHGRRRPIAFDQRSVGERTEQPDRAHRLAGRGLVVEGTRHDGRRSRRTVVPRVSRV